MSRAHPSPRTLGATGTPGRRGVSGLGERLGAWVGGAEGVDPIQRWIGLALLVAVGVVLGINYLMPDKRMIAVIGAAVLFGIVWRVDLVTGIGVLVLALPYPRGTVFGGTNVVLVLLLLLLWLLRAGMGQAARPHRTPVDVPMAALLIAFIVSFYNIDSQPDLVAALENFARILAGMGMFYLIVNNLRRPEHLERVHYFYCISIAMVGLLGIWELSHPNGVFIPGWIVFSHAVSEGINVHNVRIGGAFFDYELLSEYCAINLLLLTLMVTRARSGARRVLFGALFLLTLLIMFATVTRGGMMALGLGLLYLLWIARRRLHFVQVVVALGASVLAFLAMNYLVATFTHSGDLMARITNKESWEFQDGMPVDRAPIWKSAFERMMQHPIIGHGPVYNVTKGISFWFWPHNGYLYVGNLVGFVGLGCYLWLLFRLWQLSRPKVVDLKDENYARAYMVVAHVQLVVFLVDQTKIDFLRNPIYPFQIWLLFAFIISAHRLSTIVSPAQVPATIRTSEAAAPAGRSMALMGRGADQSVNR